MKLIQIPEAITLKDAESGEVGQLVPFAKFVRLSLLGDSRFGANYEGVKAALNVDNVLRAKPFGAITLSVSDWEKLRDAAKTPSSGSYAGFHPLAVIQLISYIDAIVGAVDAPKEP